MYYDPYVKKQKRTKKRRGCFARLMRLGVIACAILFTLYVAMNLYSLIDFGGDKAELSVNTNLPGGFTNILMLGADMDDGGTSRSDTILIASIGSGGQVKLSSLMRDTLVSIDGHGTAKLNAAYAFGGARLAMKTVNQAFGMNVTKYAVVDFRSFPHLIDALGGIELDITKSEMEEINKNVRSAVRDMGGQKSDVVYLDKYGENTHLSGAQALGYARIRMIDSDYMRAQRQRNVIDALLKKARATRDPVKLVKLVNAAIKYVETNLNAAQILSIGSKVLLNGTEMKQYRAPAEGTYESGMYDGIWGIKPDFVENQKRLITFIYGS